MVRVLIIDDEALARQRIRRLLDQYAPVVEVAGECRSGQEAVHAIRRERPELIFLDIQMKDMTGFEVLNALDAGSLPMVIFVTAYDQYAIRAFDVFAFDYLLKPLQEDRFHRSLTMALQTLQQAPSSGNQNQIRAILDYLHRTQHAAPQKAVSIKLAGKVCFLEPAEIKYIEASSYYIELYTSEKKYLVRETLAGIQERLDPSLFFRIHRSTIINRIHLQEVIHLGSGEVEVRMRDARCFRVSRSYRESFFRLLGI